MQSSVYSCTTRLFSLHKLWLPHSVTNTHMSQSTCWSLRMDILISDTWWYVAFLSLHASSSYGNLSKNYCRALNILIHGGSYLVVRACPHQPTSSSAKSFWSMVMPPSEWCYWFMIHQGSAKIEQCVLVCSKHCCSHTMVAMIITCESIRKVFEEVQHIPSHELYRS